MIASGFEAFLRSMGHRVFELSGVTWFDSQPRVLTPVSIHRQVDPQAIDWTELFATGAFAVRCATPRPWGRESFRLIIDDPNYDLSSQSGKARNQTRRGLENLAVRAASRTELLTQGPALLRDTLARQRRSVPRDFDRYWSRYFQNALASPSAHCWGAFREGSLAAFLIAFLQEDVAHILILRSATAQLRYYPNNALLYGFSSHMLRNGVCREVSIGFESLQSSLRSLDHFKEGLGFRRVAVNQYVRLAPLFDRILRGKIADMVVGGLDLFPRSERARKMAGLLRWNRDQSQGDARDD